MDVSAVRAFRRGKQTHQTLEQGPGLGPIFLTRQLAHPLHHQPRIIGMGGLPRGDLDRIRGRQHQLRRWLFEIQFWCHLFGALFSVGGKLFFQRVQRRHVFGQCRVDFGAAAEVAQHPRSLSMPWCKIMNSTTSDDWR